MTSGTNISCTVTNTYALGDLVITKKDATTGNTVTVAGTEFDVKQGANVVKHVVDNGANDADNAVGVIKVANLPTGSYSVVETKAPAGYWLPATTSQNVDVTTQGGSLTFSDPRQWAPLTATKTAQGDYDSLYHWSISKGVRAGDSGEYSGHATQSSSTGSGSFGYQVQVTEGARDVSNVAVTGKISVTNDNALPVTADLADSFGGAGWACTVNGGTTTVAVPANKTTDYSYTCTGPDAVPANGTNTATVGWSKKNYPQSQADVGVNGSYSASAQAQVTFTEHATNKTVTLSDDKFAGAPTSGPTLPASITWQSQGHQTTVLYSRTITSNAGTCTSDTNTATVKAGQATLGSASATAKLCAGADLVVTKNAMGSITRSYLWTIDKRPCGPAILPVACDLTPPKVMVGEDGTVTVPYTVEATPNGSTEIGWLMTGEITVTNNNDWEDVTLTGVTDAYPGAASCTVDTSPGLTVPKNGGSKVYPYTCTFTTQPSKTATNTATATWDKTAAATPSGSDDGSYTLKAGDWTVDDTHAVNKTVNVYDDKTDPAHPVLLGQATWNEAGTPTQFDYTLKIEGVAGACIQPTNTAFLAQAADGDRIAQDAVTVTVCAPKGLTLAKTASGSFDRTYHWTLTKQVKNDQGQWVDHATKSVPSYSAPFDYRVALTQDGFDDGNWKITGDITVTNSNDASVTDPASTTLTDTPDVGGTLTGCVNTADDKAIDGTVVTLASGASKTIHYECTFSSKPSYTGGSNTVTGTNATPGKPRRGLRDRPEDRRPRDGVRRPGRVDRQRWQGRRPRDRDLRRGHPGQGDDLAVHEQQPDRRGRRLRRPGQHVRQHREGVRGRQCGAGGAGCAGHGDDLPPGRHVGGQQDQRRDGRAGSGGLRHHLHAHRHQDRWSQPDVGRRARRPLDPGGARDVADPGRAGRGRADGHHGGPGRLRHPVDDHRAVGVGAPGLHGARQPDRLRRRPAEPVTSTGSDNCDPQEQGFPADECHTDNQTPHYTLRKDSDHADGQVMPPYLGAQGTLITYTLTVHNDSDAPINATTMPGEQVTDDLSDVLDNATWVGNLTPSGQAAFDGDHTLTWTLPEIPVDGTATLTYQVRVAGDQWDQTLTNVAHEGPGGDCLQLEALVAAPEIVNPNCTTTSTTPRYALVQVHKVDAETGESLAGAEFTLSYQDTILETETSDAQGLVELHDEAAAGDLPGDRDQRTRGLHAAGRRDPGRGGHSGRPRLRGRAGGGRRPGDADLRRPADGRDRRPQGPPGALGWHLGPR